MVMDSADPEALARWWGAVLGWDVVPSSEYDAEVRFGGDDLPCLGFERVGDPKVVKNRVHLDLSSASAADQARRVDRLCESGATLVDVGQQEAPWVVLADPEGNELCVLEPRPRYADAGPLAAIVVDVADPSQVGAFYATATGWSVARRSARVVSIYRPNGRPPDLDLVRVPDSKSTKNRVHLDVAPFIGSATDVEVTRLRGLGAREVDIGQEASAPWRVVADPDGNELCVLSPR